MVVIIILSIQMTCFRLIKEISTTKQDKQILAVFLTDVQGLYDRAPDDIECDSPPRLISQIYVTLDGKVFI